MLTGCKTPIRGLYRVGDSTTPGIGVPAVAASGILCANTLVPVGKTLGAFRGFA
jgi:phytoene dehydrogenase-like protein